MIEAVGPRAVRSWTDRHIYKPPKPIEATPSRSIAIRPNCGLEHLNFS
jgi:hypothetical protein